VLNFYYRIATATVHGINDALLLSINEQ